MTKKQKKTWTTKALRELLRIRYAAPEYALVEEMRKGTGWKARRSADAVAMSLWPSRGIYLHGFEIKAHRGDWLREKRDPEKAEEMSAYCKYWWVVAPPGLIKLDELPDAWGLLEPHGKQLRATVQAEPSDDTKTADMAFWAALLRRVTAQYVPEGRVRDLADELVSKELRDRESIYASKDEKLRRLQERVQQFESVSGVCISNEWESATKIGEAVSYLRRRGPGRFSDDLSEIASRAERLAELARAEARAVEAEFGKEEL